MTMIKIYVITNEDGVLQDNEVMTQKEAEITANYINKSREALYSVKEYREDPEQNFDFCEAQSCGFYININIYEKFAHYFNKSFTKYYYEVKDIYLKFLNDKLFSEFEYDESLQKGFYDNK